MSSTSEGPLLAPCLRALIATVVVISLAAAVSRVGAVHRGDELPVPELVSIDLAYWIAHYWMYLVLLWFVCFPILEAVPLAGPGADRLARTFRAALQTPVTGLSVALAEAALLITVTRLSLGVVPRAVQLTFGVAFPMTALVALLGATLWKVRAYARPQRSLARAWIAALWPWGAFIGLAISGALG